MAALILYIFIVFWAVHLSRRMLFCVYFWQIKEYRFDRMIGEPKSLAKVFFPKIIILALLSLLFGAILNWSEEWRIFVALIYFLLFCQSAWFFAKKKWLLPKFTAKAKILATVSFAAAVLPAWFFGKNIFAYVLAAEILLPLLSFLISQIFQIPTLLIKSKIYKKAEEKISARKDLTVIAVTGSYGKSSTKEFLYAILSKKFKVFRASGNINTEIGVAKAILNDLKPEHKVFIVEMGAYRKGEIATLCKIARPDIGIITGVNEQHLAIFKSMDNLLSAEGGRELANFLGNSGTLVLNGDNKYCLQLAKIFEGKKLIYSKSNKLLNADIWLESIAVKKSHISFIAKNKQGELAGFKADVLGGHSAHNLMAAILTAKELGMNFFEIAEAVRHIKQNQGGMIKKQGKHGIDVIDSSYSANPDGVLADLDYLAIYPNKKAIVMPCLIELGPKAAETHEGIGRKIGKTCGLAIITTKNYFNEIKKGAIESGMAEKQILLCGKPQDIYSALTSFLKSGDAVLLEGRVPSALINMLIK